MARGRGVRERGVFRPEGGGRARRRTMLREAMPPCRSAVVASPNTCVIRGWLRRAAISPAWDVVGGRGGAGPRIWGKEYEVSWVRMFSRALAKRCCTWRRPLYGEMACVRG